MKRFEDKYFDALQGVSENGKDGFSLEFKKNFKPTKVIDFTYNLHKDTKVDQDQKELIA
jgi:hypothetical protein